MALAFTRGTHVRGSATTDEVAFFAQETRAAVSTWVDCTWIFCVMRMDEETRGTRRYSFGRNAINMLSRRVVIRILLSYYDDQLFGH